jgi:histidinol-phosphate aminotransferase
MALVPPYIETLRPYEPGRRIEEIKAAYGLTRVVKLASNENPWGPSPKAIEAAKGALSGLNRYPDGGHQLREALAARFHTKVENVTVGAGSESVMANIIRTFLGDHDEVLTTESAFGGFRTLAQSRGVAYRTVPYRQWRYDLEALADAITPSTKIIYLANPNNPTGTIFTDREFEAFHKRVPERVLILLDEAYFEYAQQVPGYPDSLHYRHDNVFTLRTFSKAYGIAAMRVGYGFAHEELIRHVHKVKLPFEPGEPSQAGAIGALSDEEHLKRSIERNTLGIERLAGILRRADLIPVPSASNFIMTELPSQDAASGLVSELLQRGVIIRPVASMGLPRCVRISVGTDDELDFFEAALQTVPRTW